MTEDVGISSPPTPSVPEWLPDKRVPAFGDRSTESIRASGLKRSGRALLSAVICPKCLGRAVHGDVSSVGEDPLWTGVAERYADDYDGVRVVPRHGLDRLVSLLGAARCASFRGGLNLEA